MKQTVIYCYIINCRKKKSWMRLSITYLHVILFNYFMHCALFRNVDFSFKVYNNYELSANKTQIDIILSLKIRQVLFYFFILCNKIFNVLLLFISQIKYNYFILYFVGTIIWIFKCINYIIYILYVCVKQKVVNILDIVSCNIIVMY